MISSIKWKLRFPIYIFYITIVNEDSGRGKFLNFSFRISLRIKNWRDFEIQIFKIRDSEIQIFKIRDSETVIFPEIRDSETLFLSAEIPRLGVNLPRLNIFERPFASPNVRN